jgi:hypothetical protein
MQAASERAKHEMEFAKTQYEAEVARARAKFQGDLSRLPRPRAPENTLARDLVERQEQDDAFLAAKAEFEVELSRSIKAARQERRNKEYQQRRRNRRRRRGLDDGGEPVPVKPRPNPTPLMDGAEAPIE